MICTADGIYIGEFSATVHATTRIFRQTEHLGISVEGDLFWKHHVIPADERRQFGDIVSGTSYGRNSNMFSHTPPSKKLKKSNGPRVIRVSFLHPDRNICQEFAKFDATTGNMLFTLLQSKRCYFDISVIYIPEGNISIMSDLYLNIKVFLRIPSSPSSLMPFTDTTTGRSRLNLNYERDIDSLQDDQRAALIRIFAKLQLKSSRTNETFKFDLLQASEEEVLKAADISSEQMGQLFGPDLIENEYQENSICRAGMNYTLRAYQEKALAFMYERETSANDSQAISPLWTELVTPEGIPFFFSPYTGALGYEQQLGNTCKGGILADEMGLGKTIEMLSLIHTHQAPKTFNCPSDLKYIPSTLIVCPVNVLGQWKDEALSCLGEEHVSVEFYYGSSRSSFNLSREDHPTIYLTSYNTLACEGFSDRRSKLYQAHWFRVVLGTPSFALASYLKNPTHSTWIDEAHYIKEKSTKTSQAVFGLSAEHRWAITGTPIVNKLDDLYSLIKFLRVEPWDQAYIWKHFISVPFVKRSPESLSRVQSLLQKIMIRRTKTMKDEHGRPIVSLPPKEIVTQRLVFTDHERQVYDKLLKISRQKLYMLKGVGQADFSHVFQLLLRLRQLCIHASLLPKLPAINNNTDPVEMKDLDNLLSKTEETEFGQDVLKEIQAGDCEIECPICFETIEGGVILPCLHRMCQSCIEDYIDRREAKGEPGECPSCRQECTLAQVMQLHMVDAKTTGAVTERKVTLVSSQFKKSTKLATLEEELRLNIKEGEKTVVFSQWTSAMNLIEIILKQNRWGFTRLDGTMTQRARQSSLDKFRESEDTMVLLASLRSSGVGLNLTCASRLILFDPWWNAAVEAQAIDRVHRIGQTKSVKVSRYIIADTVEAKILHIQDRKQRLVGAVTDEDSHKLTLKDMMDMFED